MIDEPPIRLRALNDAFQTVSDLYDRLATRTRRI
jgi:hypothetical protein